MTRTYKCPKCGHEEQKWESENYQTEEMRTLFRDEVSILFLALCLSMNELLKEEDIRGVPAKTRGYLRQMREQGKPRANLSDRSWQELEIHLRSLEIYVQNTHTDH